MKQRKKRKSRRERKAKIGSHENKYSHLSSNKDLYQGTRFRLLPIRGNPGDVVESGAKYLWHNRVYELTKDTVIPLSGKCFGYFKRIK